MQERLAEFDSIGARVVAISFVQPERLRQYLSSRSWKVAVLADPERAAYRVFGLERASWWQLLRPRVIASYFRLLFRGRRPQAPQEDVHQLGGDFVFDRAGRVIYEYRSRDPADRPSVVALLEAVRRAASPDNECSQATAAK